MLSISVQTLAFEVVRNCFLIYLYIMRTLSKRRLVTLAVMIFSCSEYYGQMWTWMYGSAMTSSPAVFSVFGTQGVTTATNYTGGRVYSYNWKDGSGDFWVFGGYVGAGSGYWNDLWKFSPATSLWTWMKGSTTINQFGTYGTQRSGRASG